MFRKESEWRQHMRGVHGVRWPQEIYKPLQWYCDIGHPGPLYFSREDLKKHLTSAHSNIFTPDQQMIILEQNSVSSLRAPNTCPLCDSIPNRPSNDPNTPKDPIEESKSKHSSEKSRRLTLSSQKVSFDIDFEDMSDVDESDTLNKSTTNSKSPNRDNLSSINLERHISAHLRYIAFISIRNLIGNDESSSDASAQALGHLGNSNSSAGSQANDFDHSPLIFNENLESRQNNDDTIPDSRFDWGGSDVEDKYIGEGDEVIESVIRSGAFQSHQQATDTKVTRNSSIFGKLAKDIRSRFKGSPKPLPKPKVEPQSELELKPSLSDTNSLASCIVRDLRENNNGHEFLPYDREVTFVTPQIVGDILRETGVENANELSSFALMHAKKLFLILVMMTADSEKLSLLADLKRSEITDKSLPIMIENNADSGSDSWYSLETDIESKHELLGNWSRRDRHLLMAYQWFFLAPIFGQGTFRFKFHPNRILPYLSVSPKPANTGFFSEVSRVEIHKAHLDVNFLPTLNINKDEISIAIKKAKYDEALAVFFEKEVSNLHKLQQYKSPHLIKPIAAYQIGEDQCLIFLWAHGGNLSDYWRNFENQRLELESLHWIFGQIKGICSALDELHAGNTRHGDLKPENILWFQDESNHGIFQIADFGLAGFHEKDRQTKYRKGMMSFTPSGTSRYEPPEMDEMRATHGARSRHYDIWSMGCVLLESLVWFIYGYNSVETFRVSTTCFWESYDTPDGKKYTVHPYVDACMSVMMSDLEKYSDGTSAYKELLTLVREGLLVVEVSEIYESCPNCRETAEALHMAITDIVQNSESHESYLAAVQLKYPVDEIIYQKQRKTVYNESGGLNS
ncbi:hypothetical protein F4806DRAFT_305061 [Annulohypoxylon nitens]|nr:hypothetical protein F4806DRAFT_305061 [Annulohypoxylon nitens]